MVWIWSALFISFVLGFVLTKFGIPFLKKKRMGQTILEIGPEWHKKKEGTPTMGGIFFVLAAVAAFCVGVLPQLFSDTVFDLAPFAVLAFLLMNAAIGFVDDYVKFIKHRNKGLSALQKLIFQFAAAGLFLYLLHLAGKLDTVLVLPFSFGNWDLGAFYYLFALVFVVLVVNAVNLTDGLDGLAGTSVSVVLIFFAVFGGALEALLPAFSTAILGGVLAFLCFNRHPAKIFMGDTGSLFLGSVISAFALWANIDLALLFFGFVFLFEALSVVLQVGFFKLTHGKRLFKMAPFHHHLEKCGMTENPIVVLFAAVTLIGCVLTLFAY